MVTIDKGILDFEIARKRIAKNFSEVCQCFGKYCDRLPEGGG